MTKGLDGRCQITGIKTTKKWRGISICPEMLAEAEKIMKSTLGTTKRQALQYLKDEWHKQMMKKAAAMKTELEDKPKISLKKVETVTNEEI